MSQTLSKVPQSGKNPLSGIANSNRPAKGETQEPARRKNEKIYMQGLWLYI